MSVRICNLEWTLSYSVFQALLTFPPFSARVEKSIAVYFSAFLIKVSTKILLVDLVYAIEGNILIELSKTWFDISSS